MTDTPENPFLADGVPQWAEAVDYLRDRATSCEGQHRDWLCAVADLIEWHLPGSDEVGELVTVAKHPLSR